MRAYILFLLSTVLLVSCYKDKGNYDYTEINEIAIEGFSDTTVFYGEPYKVTPQITGTIDKSGDTARYTYKWTAIGPASLLIGDRVKELGTSFTLNLTTVTLQPSTWTIYFFVKDKETGITWNKSFKLNVSTSIFEGYLLLTDVNDKTRLDMLSYRDGNFVLMKDVLSSVGSTIPQQGKPVQIVSYNYDPTMWGIYLLTETQTTKIHPETFAWQFTYDINYEMSAGSVPATFKGKYLRGGVNMAWLVGEDDNLYYYYRVFQIKMGLPVNIEAGQVSPFKVAPFIASNSSGVAIMFDKDARRFMRLASGGAVATKMNNGTLFDHNNVKGDLRFMENLYGTDNVYAVLHYPDSVNKIHVARFAMSGVQSYFAPVLAPNVDKADFYTFSPDLGYMFYNVGSKIYEYDLSLKTSKLMIDLGNKKITQLKFQEFLRRSSKPDTYGQWYNKLMVAVEDPARPVGENGELHLYTVPPVNGDLTLFQSYTGFGKIKDFTYRER
ncbi:PKD-like family lipoprotein [Niabella sp. W65]|jgi:hypothetical protein|nr:PKD-like family lipoprotein [Niabella sp. W65]MCH7365341.1 PKD-like family lipoprotein [Niabella sp. W65]